MDQDTSLEITLHTEGMSPSFSTYSAHQLQHLWKDTVSMALFLSASLSGCPRAKKGGVKSTPTKDDKEDSELLRWASLTQGSFWHSQRNACLTLSICFRAGFSSPVRSETLSNRFSTILNDLISFTWYPSCLSATWWKQLITWYFSNPSAIKSNYHTELLVVQSISKVI